MLKNDVKFKVAAKKWLLMAITGYLLFATGFIIKFT